MKIVGLIIFLNIFVCASEYFAKIEPKETYNIKASVSGQIKYVNENVEGKNVASETIVKIDSLVDEVDLQQTIEKIKTIGEIIKLEQGTLKKFEKVRAKSQLDKDNQKIKVLNLKIQINDLITKKATLEDKISKKKLIEKNRYISNIDVKAGDFVNAGTLLYTADDLSKGKLEFFLPIDKAKQNLSKKIYLDGKATNYKINKLYKVADTKHISSYKCEIIVKAPKSFSKLIKIEFK